VTAVVVAAATQKKGPQPFAGAGQFGAENRRAEECNTVQERDGFFLKNARLSVPMVSGGCRRGSGVSRTSSSRIGRQRLRVRSTSSRMRW
jgi:hypothetical protein